MGERGSCCFGCRRRSVSRRVFCVMVVLTVVWQQALSAEERPLLPAGAYITDMLVDPADSEALWVATNGAGIYYRPSLDAPWEARPLAGPRRTLALAMGVGPSPRLLSGGEASGPPLGPDGAALTILDIAPHPADPELIFVLAPDGVWRVRGPHGLAAEQEWKRVFSYSDWLAQNRQPDWPEGDWAFTRFQKLSIDAHYPDTLLLGARWEGGFHRSDDGGQTWTHHSLGGIFRRGDEVRVDPFDPSLYYAFTHHQGLLKSFNRGRSWVVAGSGLVPQKRTPHYGAYLLGGISFDSHIPGRILAGSDYSTWISEDRGETWTEVGMTLTCEFVRASAFHPKHPSILYAGSNVGVFQSTDGGLTWSPANEGLPERTLIKSFDAEIAGRRFAFALVSGNNPVYRRPLDAGPRAPWRSMSWLINEAASDLVWNAQSAELILTTTSGTRLVSKDGGFRWSVPAVVYADRPVRHRPSELPSAARPGDLVIQNAVMPDPSPLLDWYKRPPFVRIQLVGRRYPADGSLPIWETHWESQLWGPLMIPDALQDTLADLVVEVRDFQDGTRAGRTPYRGPDSIHQVAVSPVHNTHR
jgi:hypothetical protein